MIIKTYRGQCEISKLNFWKLFHIIFNSLHSHLRSLFSFFFYPYPDLWFTKLSCTFIKHRLCKIPICVYDHALIGKRFSNSFFSLILFRKIGTHLKEWNLSKRCFHWRSVAVDGETFLLLAFSLYWPISTCSTLAIPSNSVGAGTSINIYFYCSREKVRWMVSYCKGLFDGSGVPI